MNEVAKLQCLQFSISECDINEFLLNDFSNVYETLRIVKDDNEV